MNEFIWKPNTTVAAVIERDGKFLFVEEISDGTTVLNQPAGHVEPGESIAEACIREVLEETGYSFRPESIVGVYYWHAVHSGTTYLRFAFSGSIVGHDPQRPLDEGILRPIWLTADELAAESARHRSPMVSRCVADYRAGRRYPMQLIAHYTESFAAGREGQP